MLTCKQCGREGVQIDEIETEFDRLGVYDGGYFYGVLVDKSKGIGAGFVTVTEGEDTRYSIPTGPGEEGVELIRVRRRENCWIGQNTVLAFIRR